MPGEETINKDDFCSHYVQIRVSKQLTNIFYQRKCATLSYFGL